MAQEIFCPNCGGLIFSSDPDAMDMQPCTCATQAAPKASSSASIATQKAESTSTSEARVGARVSEPAAPVEEKICVKCGKDVNGHRRLKDDDGNYWCYACAKADDKKKRAQTEAARSKCALCGEEVAITNLIAMDGRFVCPRCVREQRELEKKTENRIGRINSAYKGQDWKRLGPMLGALGVCALIIILRYFRIIGS